MKQVIGVVLLACVFAIVQAGNPDCQRNGNASARTAENMSDSRGRSRARGYLQKHKMIPLADGVQQYQTPPTVATSYTQLPATSNGVTGPHSDNRPFGNNFVSDTGRASVSCQIDCLSYVPQGRQIFGRPMFTGCRHQFYSYGAERNVGCFVTNSIMQTQAQIAMDVCHHYNGCQYVFVPADPVASLRKAKGSNSVGKFVMKIFGGVVKAVKFVGKAIGKVGKAVGKFFKRLRF